MEVEVLLECNDIIIVPVENVRELPVEGSSVLCKNCRNYKLIRKVGIPYRVERHVKSNDEDQESMLGGQ